MTDRYIPPDDSGADATPAPLTPEVDSPPPEADGATRRAHTFLGRLTHAVREQNWFAVVLELMIVIVGVVIGFQVTAWAQERDRSDRAAIQRDALREDFLANRKQLTRVLVDLERAAGMQREMLRVIHGASPRPDADSLARLVFSTVTFARFEPVLGAYEAMLSAGDLRLISDSELRSNLAQFAEMAESGYEDEGQIAAQRVQLFEYLRQHGDLLSIVYPEWREGVGLPVSSMTMDYDALLASPEFSSLVTPMAFGETQMLGYYGRMEELLDAVLVGLGVDPDDDGRDVTE